MSIEDENVQSFLKNALIDSRNVIKEMSKEIIKDIIDAIDSRPAKKVETKTILSCEEFDNLKKRIRKEMAEECHILTYEIILLIYEKTYMSEKDASIHSQSCLDSILKIIRGD